MLRRLATVGLVALIVLGVSWWLLRGSRSAATEAGGPMVQMLSSNGFMLVWDRPPANAIALRIREAEGQWQDPRKHAGARPRLEVPLDGLQPGTFYEYEFTDTAGPTPQVLARGRTRTAPKRGGEFRFLAFGDGGTGEQPQYDLARLMPPYDADVAIHTGDLVYTEGAAEDYPRKFYAPYAELLKRTAFYPCLGNHDYDTYQGGPMFAAFVLPTNGPAGAVPERHYWFDIADVRFVALDSNEGFSGLRAQVVPWLDEVLRAAGERWKVVYFHHPAYTAGKYDPAGRVLELLVPVFDRHGVSVVFCGHNHMYERSHPLRGGQIVEPGQGPVYVTTGAAGGELYEVRSPRPEYLVEQDNTQFSFTVVDVSAAQLHVRQIGQDGKVIDEFQIPRATQAEPS